MGRVYLLDCTLRDGGYINNWNFGLNTIRGFCKKIARTGVEMCELGFIKGEQYNPDKSLFPDTESFKNVIGSKNDALLYVGMIDMGAPVPIERIDPYDGTSIDVVRVIFKKNKIDDALVYCKRIQELGYKVSVNFVGTDLYTDSELIDGIKKFNAIRPFAVSIVDSFGLIKRKQFLRMVYIADNNLEEGIILAYHAHNNLQQAFGNAEALTELNLKRDIIIDACVFGMGRGAGNLNLELFAEYMNENYNSHYNIEPMLEIIDEYLADIYKIKTWGYSLPLYLSATTHCHPNYAIYYEEKSSLTVKAFNELLRRIPDSEKSFFSVEKAEQYYREYLENYMDDRETISELSQILYGKKIIILAPGKSLFDYNDTIKEMVDSNTVTIAINCLAEEYYPDFIFSSNMKRFAKIQDQTSAETIVTSNMEGVLSPKYIVNFSSYAIDNPEIVDNSGLMLLKLLVACGIKQVKIAGMDGYSLENSHNYYNTNLEYDFDGKLVRRNEIISNELRNIGKMINIEFITPTVYKV